MNIEYSPKRETKTQSLIRLANKRGITQSQIATITQTSQPTICDILKGTGTDRKAAGIVDVRLGDYLGRVEFLGEVYCLAGGV